MKKKFWIKKKEEIEKIKLQNNLKIQEITNEFEKKISNLKKEIFDLNEKLKQIENEKNNSLNNLLENNKKLIEDLKKQFQIEKEKIIND